ncbi:MAG: helix-turn-helix domain-containing protein [Acidobacteriota bacterium]
MSPIAGMEPIYTPQEVAAWLKVDESTVRRLFIDRPDVLKLGRAVARGKRRSYLTLRIPLSVVERFIREHSKGAGR